MAILRSPWILAIVALLINLGIVTGTILMQTPAILASIPVEEDEHEEKEADPQSKTYWHDSFSEFEGLYHELDDREARLNEREEALDARAASLASEQQQLEEFQEQLKRQREQLRDILIEVEAEELVNLKRVARTYGEMEPAEVVPILTQLPDEQVIKILLQMSPEVMAGIFSAMINSDNQEQLQAKRVARFTQEMRRYHNNEATGPR